jgi:hypothetical protein
MLINWWLSTPEMIPAVPHSLGLCTTTKRRGGKETKAAAIEVRESDGMRGGVELRGERIRQRECGKQLRLDVEKA